MDAQLELSSIDQMAAKHTITIILAVLALVVFWPWLGNPFGYVHLKDSVRTSIPVALVFGDPCATYKDGYISYDPSPNCYRFEEAGKFEGIWLYEFEGSTFLENATRVPLRRPPYKSTAWLNYEPERIDAELNYGFDDAKDCYSIHAFQISFIGRRNPQGGGHMGLFGSEIWPQKILSAKRLPGPDCQTYSD